MTMHRAHDDVRSPFAELAESTASLVTDVLGHVERLVTGVVADAEEVARDARDLWDFTREQATVFGHTVRSLPRFTRVAGELLRVAAEYRWHLALADARAGRREAESQEALAALHARNARRLYALCVELRGAILKLGQFASSRVDLLPDAYVQELSRLQDRVPPVPFEAIAERIEQELAEGAMSFAAFDVEPLAAASFAQVHAARLEDGRRVAVKVQVPGIEEDVEADLAALRLVAPALGDLLPSIDLDTIAKELTTAVRGELDYDAEAANAKALADCFRADDDVVIPRVHEDLSTRRVLSLERVGGERIVDYLDACERRGEGGARDRDRLFAILIRTFCAQVLEHGLLHADPHPGNFLVQTTEDGPRLVLLDFGCVQRYSPARRRAYAQLGFAVLAGNRERLAELFGEMGFASRDGGTASLGAFADLMLEAFRSDSAAPLEALDPSAALERVLRLTRDNPIVAIPGDFVMLGRVFASLGGLLMRYRPHVNLFQILMPYLAKVGG